MRPARLNDTGINECLFLISDMKCATLIHNYYGLSSLQSIAWWLKPFHAYDETMPYLVSIVLLASGVFSIATSLFDSLPTNSCISLCDSFKPLLFVSCWSGGCFTTDSLVTISSISICDLASPRFTDGVLGASFCFDNLSINPLTCSRDNCPTLSSLSLGGGDWGLFWVARRSNNWLASSLVKEGPFFDSTFVSVCSFLLLSRSTIASTSDSVKFFWVVIVEVLVLEKTTFSVVKLTSFFNHGY